MGDFFVHNVQLYDYKPVSINALAYNEDTEQLAVGFKNGAVAIHLASQDFYQTQYILPSVLTSVEGLSWLGKRLFSCGMTGYVSELDPRMGTLKRQVPTHAMGAWCMAANQQQSRLAVGTEAGAVCLFKIDETSGDLEFVESLQRSPSRVLAISWSSFDANLIAAAGVGFVAVVDVRHGVVQREFPTRPENAVVWDAAFLTEDLLATADSTGHVVLWSLSSGGAMQRFSAHKSHVLCLAVQGSSLFAAGVDAVIRRYDRQGDCGEWFEATLYRGHSHDVRALAVTSQGVASGGEEGRIKVFPLEREAAGVQEGRQGAWPLPFMQPRHPHRVAMSRPTNSHDGPAPALCVLMYQDRLELVRLGVPSAPTTFNKRQRRSALPLNKPLPLSAAPQRLLVVAAKRDESIACCAVSSCATLLAYSTGASLRAFSLRKATDGKGLALDRLPLAPKPPCRLLAFAPASAKLVGVRACDGAVLVWDLGRAVLLCEFVPRGAESTSPDTHLLTCGGPASDLIALGCLDGYGYVYALDGTRLSRLPVRKNKRGAALLPIAMAFSVKQKRLLTLYTDHKFLEVDLNGGVLGDGWFARFNEKAPSTWPYVQHCDWMQYIDGFRVLLANQNQVFVLDTSQRVPKGLPRAMLSEESHAQGRKRPQPLETLPCLRASDRFRFLVHVEALTKTELAMVCISPDNYALALPPVLHHKRFGV